jgi:cytochrome c oxidase subunit 2
VLRSNITWVVLLCASWSTSGFAQVDPESGRRGYEVCAGCHGFVGEGNVLVDAPRLAGLESWYLERQMRNFMSGVRGTSIEDPHGRRMATMAAAVRGNRQIDDLVAYIGLLPVAPAPPTVEGNLEEGRRRYAVCAACHGLGGTGNEALSSPGLAGLDDWYVMRQLELYAAGLRGAHADDPYGQQMRALAAVFPDEQTRRDLAAYLASLNR